MSHKGLVIILALIIALCLAGVWLGAIFDVFSEGMVDWLGRIGLGTAVMLLFVIYKRQLASENKT